MTHVPTVLGDVDCADLGPVYMHEHIFLLSADVQQNYPAEWGSEDDRIADAAGKLRAVAAPGSGWRPTSTRARSGSPPDCRRARPGRS